MRWLLLLAFLLLPFSAMAQSWPLVDPSNVVFLGHDEAISGTGDEHLDVYTGDVTNYKVLIFVINVYPDEDTSAQILRSGELTSLGVRHAEGDDQLRNFIFSYLRYDSDPGTVSRVAGGEPDNRVFKMSAAHLTWEDGIDPAAPYSATIRCVNLMLGPICYGTAHWYMNDGALEGPVSMEFVNTYPVDMTAAGGMAGLSVFWAASIEPYTYYDIVGTLDMWGVLKE